MSGGAAGSLSVSSFNVGFGASQVEVRNFYFEGGSLGDALDCLWTIVGCAKKNLLTVDEWGVLYGRRFRDGNLILSTGIGHADYDNTRAIERDRNDVYTLPLELTWSFRRRDWRGFELNFAVSYSSTEIAYGVTFGVDVGQLRGW